MSVDKNNRIVDKNFRIVGKNDTLSNVAELDLDLERIAPKLSFVNRRILCLGAVHSGFTKAQIDKLKAVCVNNDALSELLTCLE